MFLDFYWNFFCPRSRISPKTTEFPRKFPFSGNFPPPSFVSYTGRTFPALIHLREKEHHPMQHIWKVLLTSLLIFALAATACSRWMRCIIPCKICRIA